MSGYSELMASSWQAQNPQGGAYSQHKGLLMENRRQFSACFNCRSQNLRLNHHFLVYHPFISIYVIAKQYIILTKDLQQIHLFPNLVGFVGDRA